VPEPAVEDQASADPGSQAEHGEAGRPSPGAEAPFAVDGAVDVVLDGPDPEPGERAAKILPHEGFEIGRLDQVPVAVEQAGDRQAGGVDFRPVPHERVEPPGQRRRAFGGEGRDLGLPEDSADFVLEDDLGIGPADVDSEETHAAAPARESRRRRGRPRSQSWTS
jgi:hypothetical protein